MTSRRVSGPGRKVDYYPTAAAVAAGAMIVLGDNVFHAEADIPQNTLGSISGGDEVLELPKADGTSTALNIGDEAYWDGTDATADSSGTTPLNGYFVAKPGGTSATVAAADADTTVWVARR